MVASLCGGSGQEEEDSLPPDPTTHTCTEHHLPTQHRHGREGTQTEDLRSMKTASGFPGGIR